jgi:cellulose biosynthesis protein BcsE
MTHPTHALVALQVDLERAIRPRRRLLLLRAASANWQELDDAALRNWLVRWTPWLEARLCTLLIISHGNAGVSLTARLLTHNGYLSGLARLQRRPGHLHFLMQYWRNSLGVSGASELILHEDAAGFYLHESPPVPLRQSNDEDLYLAQKEALEGAPLLSERRLLAADADELFTRALHAQTATIVFCIDHSDQFEPQARMIHRLRMQCGMALKIVVREMAPSLRRHDEQALIACGTNLIVPVRTTLSRFLVMLESIQGQVLQRPIVTDIEPLLHSTQSLRLRGLVTPAQFVDYLKTVVKNSLNNDPAGVLVALEPVQGLKAAQALTQSHLRRYGDVVCELNNQLYLFLFGCQPNTVETALANIFCLPYQELFLGHDVFVTVEQIQAQAQRLHEQRPNHVAQAPWIGSPVSAGSVTSPQPTVKQRPLALAPVPRKLLSVQGASSE